MGGIVHYAGFGVVFLFFFGPKFFNIARRKVVNFCSFGWHGSPQNIWISSPWVRQVVWCGVPGAFQKYLYTSGPFQGPDSRTVLWWAGGQLDKGEDFPTNLENAISDIASNMKGTHFSAWGHPGFSHHLSQSRQPNNHGCLVFPGRQLHILDHMGSLRAFLGQPC